jgi:Tfp pilus assembly protein PilF
MKNYQKIYTVIIVIFIAAVLGHISSLKNSFVMDDFSLIAKNHFISEWENTSIFISKDFYKYPYIIDYGSRPLTLISLMVDIQFFEHKKYGFHVTNLILHGLNSVLVFVIFLIISKEKYFLPAALAGLIFALHPLQAEAVNIASFRADLLVTFFYLAALAFFVKSYDLGKPGAVMLQFISAFCFLLAMFSKEMSVTLPIVFLLFSVLYKDRISIKDSGNWISLILLISTLCFLNFFWKERFVYSHYNILYLNIAGGINPLSSFAAYINTVLSSLLHYIGLLFFPAKLSVDYLIKLPEGIINFSNIFVILVIGTAGYIFIKAKNILLRFGIGFFFIAYLPISNVVPLANTVADRYMYLPLAGFSIFIASVIMYLPDIKILRRVPLKIFLSGLIVVSFFTQTFARSTVFKDMFSLYSEAVKVSPENARARYNLALAYMSNDKWAQAIAELNKTEELNPLYERYEMWYNLGVCYQKLGDFKNSKKYYIKTLLLEPNKEALKNYSDILWQEGNIAGVIWLLEKSIAIMPDAVSFNNIGVCYIKQKKYKKAIQSFVNATNIKSDYEEAWYNLIDACESSGDKAQAEKETDRMADIFSRNGWKITTTEKVNQP